MPDLANELGSAPVSQEASRRPRVLVADDHALSRRQLVRALERDGAYLVVGTAADGREALALVHSLAPDMAVLDIRMPGLDGLEVARRIRDEGLRTRVVLLSAYEAAGYREAARRAGAAALLSKSLSEEELQMALADTLKEDRL